MAKAPRSTRKASALAETATAETAEQATPAVIERTPDEIRDALVAVSAPRRSVLSEDVTTSAQRTFFLNRGFDVGTAAKALGMDGVKALAVIMAPETLTAEDRTALAREASRSKVVRGGKSDYYTGRGMARFAWNDGAPRMDKATAKALTLQGIVASGLAVEGI